MAGATLRSLSLPRFALRRDEAAAALAISPSTFDGWIRKGRLPEGKPIDGIVLWETERLRTAFQALMDLDENTPDDGDNPFDHKVV